MKLRPTMAALAVAWLSLIGQAAVAAPEEPPFLPLHADEATTKAWATRYLVAHGDVLAAALDSQAFFYSPQTAQRSKQGRPTFWLRYEFARTPPIPGSGFRSARRQMEIDCDAYRYFELGIETYPRSNLAGDRHEELPALHWFDVVAGSTDAVWFSSICKTLAPGSNAATPAAVMPSDASAAQVSGWVARLNTHDFIVVGQDATGAAMYQRSGVEPQPDGHVLAVIRIERSLPSNSPQPRSQYFQVEFDCARQRAHVFNTVSFELNNLDGTISATPAAVDWGDLPGGSLRAKVADAICKISL